MCSTERVWECASVCTWVCERVCVHVRVQVCVHVCIMLQKDFAVCECKTGWESSLFFPKGLCRIKIASQKKLLAGLEFFSLCEQNFHFFPRFVLSNDYMRREKKF